MIEMVKKSFLELVEEVKKTGIAEALYKVSNAEELKEVWNKFSDENQDLLSKIKDWATEFENDDDYELRAIFKAGENIDNPMEIVIVIFIIDDFAVSECDIFEDYGDLTCAVKSIDNDFATAVAAFIAVDFIYNIKLEDIFNTDSDED